MKKLYYVLLCCAAAGMLVWFAGCSSDQPKTVSGPAASPEVAVGEEDVVVNAGDAVLVDQPNDEATITVACCLSPYVQCLSTTDTSITVRLCAQSTGAPGGFRLQWAAVPVGLSCTTFPFPTTGIPTITIPGPVSPYSCRTVTITGLTCGTTYALRGYAVNQYGCNSPPSSRVCCTTQNCEELPPCPGAPTLICQNATDTGFTIHICNGPAASASGVVLQFAPLPAGTSCGNFTWPAVVPGTVTLTTAIAPNGCVNIQVANLACATNYVFRARFLSTATNCSPPYSLNLCCQTNDCEQLPCEDVPTVQCLSATDTSLTVRICAGTTGAACGLTLNLISMTPDDTAVPRTPSVCAAFVWPGSGFQTYNIGALAANACKDTTITGLDCERWYAFRALTKACPPAYPCPSSYSANACCQTGTCEEQPPCPGVPTVTCQSTSDTSVTLHICNAPNAGILGFRIQYMELAAGTLCANANWPGSPTTITVNTPLAASACTDYEVRGLTCGTDYVFHVLPISANTFCLLPYLPNLCCTTDDCEQLPCIDAPTVNCVSATDTSLTVRICAGPSGAGCGIQLSVVEAPGGAVSTLIPCASLDWPRTGERTQTVGPLGPNECVDYTIYNRQCQTLYTIRAKALACPPYPCESDYSASVCCWTEDCPPVCVDLPTVSCLSVTDTTLTVQVCAGASGAGSGVQVQYVLVPTGTTCANFTWPASGVSSTTTAALGANACTNVTLHGLLCGRTYAVRVRGLVFGSYTCPLDYSAKVCCTLNDCEETPGGGCTYTQGYWKNHSDAWPVTSLMIGSQSYTQLQLIATLQRSSAGGNALVILAKQLIAAKLNILNGADPSAVAATIAQADALIGALNITNGFVASSSITGQQMVTLANILDRYNNGLSGVPHCS